MLRKMTLMPALAGLLIAGCASAPEPVVEKQYLSDEAFGQILQSIYNSKPPKRAEDIATQTLARTDLTDTQRASMLYQRGVARGGWIGEWPEAYPQCATGDYLAMLEIAPDHEFAEKAVEEIEYQTGRSIYFDQEPFLGAPEACDAYHQQGLEYLESRQ